MPQFPASIELSSLDGTTGFRIIGEAGGDYSGFSVAGAGDINGDGFDDLLIGAPMANSSSQGASYVVFGKGGGFSTTLSLSTLDGTNGFQINGAADTDMSGRSVSSGDFNGDNIGDLLIGALNADPNGVGSGASYVVFGKNASKGNFVANLDLSTLDGSNGFQIHGVAEGDYSGSSVANAGDINGDKIDDLIIGAFRASANGAYSGASYVVFGTKAGFSADFQLSALTGTNGFKISGAAEYDYSGLTVNSAGDINGDGFDDLVIGAKSLDVDGYADGGSFIVFGKASGFGSNFALSSLNGGNGFKIASVAAADLSGFSVASIGDMNGDLIDDLVIGAFNADPNGLSNSGASYVIFGTKTGFTAASFDLSTLNGSNGFQINGEAAGDYSGRSVSSAGDVNGDNFDDLLIGASEADANGANSGASYVLFGKAGGFAATIDLSGLDGVNGFKIKGEAEGDYSGHSISSAGDVNGDGFDDLIIGAYGADANGLYSGTSYVFFGHEGAVDTPGVNDAPSGTNKTIAIIEDGSYTFTLGDFGFTDIDNNGFEEILITTLPANGTLKLGTVDVQQADRIKASDITALGLVFKPDDNASGNNYTSFEFQVVDDGAFGNGSENIDPMPNTIRFNVTATNDGAPVLTGTAAALAAGTEGVAYIIEAVDLLSGFTDADNDLLSVTGLTAGNGALVDNEDGTWTFNPQANYSGAVKLDYIVTDGKGGNTTATNTFNLAGVNDAPSGTDKTIIAIEDKAIALTATDFGFTDIENNAFLSVTIVTTTTKGSLMLDGVKVTDQQSIGVDKLAGLSFIGTKDQFGKAYDSFTFKVRDNGGGTDTDPTANTMTFDVDAVIDRFIGTRGKDKRVGTDGDDYFDTKSGNDVLTGKLGQDKFFFRTGHDRDVIKDFDAIGAVHDTLDIRKLNSIVNFKDLIKNHADQVGRNVVIDGLNGDAITLNRVKLRDLDAGDFLF